MPLTTELTTRFGLRHPIVLAPMDYVADARLANAVSRAVSPASAKGPPFAMS